MGGGKRAQAFSRRRQTEPSVSTASSRPELAAIRRSGAGAGTLSQRPSPLKYRVPALSSRKAPSPTVPATATGSMASQSSVLSALCSNKRSLPLAITSRCSSSVTPSSEAPHEAEPSIGDQLPLELGDQLPFSRATRPSVSTPYTAAFDAASARRLRDCSFGTHGCAQLPG